MTVSFASGLGEIRPDSWEELLSLRGRPSPFLSPEFLLPWYRAFGERREVLVARWAPAGGPDRGLLFLHRREAGGWEFLGGTEVADYLDALVAPGCEEGFWRDFLAEGLPALGGGSLVLPGLVEGTPSLPALRRACADAGLPCAVEEMDRAPYVSLPGSFDEYIEGLGTKERHELRRKIRRAGELLSGLAFRVTETAGELDRDLASFVSLHRKSHPEKERFMDGRMEDFFREVAGGFFRSGRLRLAFLSGGGKDVASVFQFLSGGALLLYNSGYDPALRAAHPGLVLIARSIGRAVEEGFAEYDFLRGRERYKYDLGGVDRAVYRLTISA